MKTRAKHDLKNETQASTERAALYCDVTPATIRNWTRYGVNGIVLESFVRGARIKTSIEACDRFNAACKKLRGKQ
jgi:hypothetical protein